MSKHSMVCAGIDTGKRKLDVALDASTGTLQVAVGVTRRRALIASLA